MPPTTGGSTSGSSTRARSTRCPLCEGQLTIEEHLAVTVAGRRLRVAKGACAVCRAPRVIYFELAAARLN